jgi:DNA-binding NarL/FixJ family response regulator
MISSSQAPSLGVTRLMLVSRQRLLRDCLAARFAASRRFALAGQSHSLEEAIAQAPDRGARLLLVDGACLDDRAYSLLSRLGEELKTVVLGLSEGHAELRRCAEAGISGFVDRESAYDDLAETLEAVARGRRVCSGRSSQELFDRLARLGRRCRRSDQMEALVLTPRQMEVLRLMADGHGNAEIARRLHLSHYTVKNHVHNILAALAVKDRTEAVAHAYRRRWLA